MANSGNQGWNPRKITRRLNRNCLECNQQFYTYPSLNKTFCSVSCKNRYILKVKPIWNKNKKTGDKGVISGEKHWNWQGGKDITAQRRERVRFSQHFQPKILARDNYTCQICHVRGGNLQVDHIKKWSEYPDLRFDLLNCRTLCMSCHYYVTFKRNIPQGVVWGHNLRKVY